MQTERLTLKLSKSDKLALQQIARTEGETLAVVVRKILRESLERRGLLPINTPSPTVDTIEQEADCATAG